MWLVFFEIIKIIYSNGNLKMKFDTIMANPPFKRGMWRLFLEKSLSLSDIVIQISPNPSNLESNHGIKFRELCINHGIQSIADCTGRFLIVKPGNIGVFYFNQKMNSNVNAFIDESIQSRIVKKVLYFDEKADHIVAKRGLVHPRRIQTTETQSENQIPIITSVGNKNITTRYISVKDAIPSHIVKRKCVVCNRFFGKYGYNPVYEIDLSDFVISSNVISFDLIEPIENFKSVYLSKLYRFVIIQQRNGGMDTQAAMISSLPKLNLNRFWSDDEIYKHFNLTPDEVDEVERHDDESSGSMKTTT